MYGMVFYQNTRCAFDDFGLGLSGRRVAEFHEVSSKHGDLGAANQAEHSIKLVAN